ncbi:lytic murein transglycosylase B [Burkholderia sp. WAC0059]|uniref:lytic murein transglycosylase B n=1 Tax=Burkholderia sp. WAC0059 TaxID=2066022 RepID=UPI002155ED4E|nr:lytic murein transglycosylase B [Burkholderia sp. WAC0059]
MTLKFAPSASGRLRTTTLAIALCAALPGWPGRAFAQTTVPQPQLLAQAQPQPSVPHGQTFEEEIIPQRYANNPDVDAFINDMVARYDFDPTALHTLFAGVNYSATAVKFVTPAPAPHIKNWYAYESRFLDPVRINAGVRFWRANQAALQRAYDQYGVPPEVIVGILGIETIYGRYMGNFRVIDALTTLSFDYPNTPNRADRMATFRKNLEDYLVWTRDAQIDPTTVFGSYTGAIGIPQFLPSSIVQYAVDYDGTKQIDLRTSAADAIGSVANYLKQNGWETGRPVIWHIADDPGSQGIAQAAADGQPAPHWPLEQLLRSGLLLNEPGLDTHAEAGTPVTVVDLPTPGLPTRYVLGLQNFYALTRYNRSFFYAMAVYELGMRIKAQMLATEPDTGVGSSNGVAAGTPGIAPGVPTAPPPAPAPTAMPGMNTPATGLPTQPPGPAFAPAAPAAPAVPGTQPY